ncbi:MAG: ribosome-associated translation inhibitor RaiA [Rikenellaceae bacterium]|jgi:putative sigma-54 modulation protein|nr:ribosome-associated translation inhibitor RaiA [Rikenellaceae bacterium]
MEIRIQSVKFDADKKLVAFIEEKVSKLDRFADDILAADVTLKLDKDSSEHANKVAVLKLDVAGDTPVAERRSKSFEEAVDLAIDAVKVQLSKHKNKA